MIYFNRYVNVLREEKNLHLNHVEDVPFLNGSSGIDQASNFVHSVAEMLMGNSKSKTNVSTKWDGAPACICGINPENGKFFVASKSLFNATPKINYTNADIDANHPGGLGDKLKTALKYLPQLGIKTILQGDFMYDHEILKHETVDGVPSFVFQPNTIVYVVPKGSDLYDRIAKSKMGIVFHTEYTGKTIQDLSASFNINLSKLKKTKDVWFDDAFLKDVSGTATFTIDETKEMVSLLNVVNKMKANVNRKFVDDLVKNHPDINMILQTFTNHLVRAGTTINDAGKHTALFIAFLADKQTEAIDKLKSEKGKAKKQDVRQLHLEYVRANSRNLVGLFEFHKAVAEAKLMIVKKLEKLEGMKTFVRDADGYRVVGPEGFVAVDHNGSAVKLVDRMTFSKNNFTVQKDWAK